MSQCKLAACTYILRDYFDVKVEKVGKYLAENGASALRMIANKIKLGMDEVLKSEIIAHCFMDNRVSLLTIQYN